MTITTPTRSVDSGWVPTTPVYRDRPQLSFPGEPTPAPGLVIVPSINVFTGRYTGGWTIIHTRTGLHLALVSIPLAYAREAAVLLADAGVDWTLPAQQLREQRGDVTHVVWDIRNRVHESWQDGRPTWWARHSWQHLAPGWIVQTDDWTQSDYVFDTWNDLDAWLTEHGANPAYRVEDVTRQIEPTWRLCCAAPLCDNRFNNPVLLDQTDDDDVPFEVRERDRGDVARFAATVGWTRHDRAHWTCPDCTREHTRKPDREFGS
ncbi:hypothetical protein [Kibdelosporangium aridum]|uniref:Uncharacterized protein n=1 Tax=Kibdelosporangium aridum TaxID=2030 RepID=A0A1W2DPR8_KIBAR|nr:hypothetical protein [Kibdelosporangium aridum]SMC99002.1 hypothetical protein SAMN05661093_03624 [Kibdelosporangium aridum]